METYKVDTRPTVLLIDGAHALRRAMYQPSLRDLSNANGVPTGAIFGFMNILRGAINSMSANSVVVCWEGGHSERRLEVYDQYKHRDYEGDPERDSHGMTDYEYYSHQLSWIKKILEMLGVHQLRVDGKEGDDVLYQACHLLGGRKIIISEDRDFYALVNEDVSLYRPIKKEYIDNNNFKEISGGYSTPKHYLYGKVLSGDGSDNIPSVAKGFGEKSILTILEKIEDPNELSPKRLIQEAAKIGNSRMMKLVDAGEEPIIRNLNLVDISREPFDIFQLQGLADELSTQHYPNIAMVTKIFKTLEFNEENTRGIINKISQMSEYSLAHLIDKTYIRRVMTGEI